jgi:feruloyl esterase
MRILVGGLYALLLAASMAVRPASAAGSCESLATMSLPNTTVTLARTVDAGPFTPGGGVEGAAQGGAKPLNAPRAFCRVAATLSPSADSDIKVEIWMPAANWNGKFQAVGNGAFTGSIAYPAMMAALGRGYATASTDTGHVGNTASFALGHPEKVIDFGWRAVHEMTVLSKKIVASYYDAGPRFSYWNGCSAGGRQALKAAQRFPGDFDGIIAGAPGLDWTGRASQAVYVAQALEKDEKARLSSAKAKVVHAAVLAACDAGDGVKDGVLEDPKACTFDPAVLQCRGAEEASCLTSAQVGTVRMLYSAQVNSSTKRPIGGLLPGSELGWTDMGWTASARATGLEQFRFLVFKDPRWEISKFNPATDFARAEESDDDTINALDPNLKPFIARGGKLIQYHGWSDPQISPAASVQYYERVVAALGGVDNVHGSYRLFMAPGMGHCGGGEGPNTFDMVAAVEQWVEQGKAPDRIIASRSTQGVVDRTRPLCPYPQRAVYKGSGSTDDAANFECTAR